MRTELAIAFAGVVIALTLGLVGRWQIAASGDKVYRLDRWTGEIDQCGIEMDPPTFKSRLRHQGVVTIGCRYAYIGDGKTTDPGQP
jgi:hypothetical protein